MFYKGYFATVVAGGAISVATAASAPVAVPVAAIVAGGLFAVGVTAGVAYAGYKNREKIASSLDQCIKKYTRDKLSDAEHQQVLKNFQLLETYATPDEKQNVIDLVINEYGDTRRIIRRPGESKKLLTYLTSQESLVDKIKAVGQYLTTIIDGEYRCNGKRMHRIIANILYSAEKQYGLEVREAEVKEIQARHFGMGK